MARARQRGLAGFLLVSLLFVIQLVCLRSHEALRPSTRQLSRLDVQSPHHSELHKSHDTASSRLLFKRDSLSFDEQKHTIHEPAEDSPSWIDYLAVYDRITDKTAKGFAFIGLIVWLVFLFAFVGIVAADFFCPNLSTISAHLGLSESVAGCSLLAFGNGSPDVFSTYSALNHGSGSLAIGELIGAASFIVSVVAGSMAIVKPFKVARHSFLRDVGFFTMAIIFTMFILADGQLKPFEAALMIVLYVIYVITVAVGSWWLTRRARQRELLRKVRDEYAQETLPDLSQSNGDVAEAPPHTSPAGMNNSTRSTSSSPAHPYDILDLDDEDALLSITDRGTPVTLSRNRSINRPRSASTATVPYHPSHGSARRTRTKMAVRSSLLSAIEFRDVVNSLQADSTARTLAVFGQAGLPDTPHFHGVQTGPARIGHGRSRSHAGLDTERQASRQRHARHLSDLNSPRSAVSPLPTSAMSSEEAGDPFAEVFGQVTAGRLTPRDLMAKKTSQSSRRSEETVGTPPLIEVDDPWRSTTPERPSKLRLQIPTGSAIVTESPVQELPSILVTTDQGKPLRVGSQSSLKRYATFEHYGGRAKVKKIFRTIIASYFPSLQDIKSKSIVGTVVAIVCAPALLVLNLTLPVVDEEDDECCEVLPEPDLLPDDAEAPELRVETPTTASQTEESDPEEALVRSQQAVWRRRDQDIAHVLHAQAVHHHSPALHPMHRADDSAYIEGNSLIDHAILSKGEEQQQQSESDLQVDGLTHFQLWRAMTTLQCFFAPIFVVVALLGDDLRIWYLPTAIGVGLLLAIGAYKLFNRERHPLRLGLCFVGFIVAMVWILTIVNEVVGVLRAIGHIFGLSDAILGLTIFAMGASLGDLVTNVTVARMGFPLMAMSACTAGPMLNILLGVGISGSIIMAQTGENYTFEISPTLIVSGVGLLVVLVSTLIVVPLNGFWMTRRWGGFLIAAYLVTLTVNVTVEVLETKGKL
ncbi:uncharacterized protein L969DRAFT_18398 [Mixia osmundae IAM 14324]|uniref:Sodium/calcium exchanger membrane region domain-containing protein n=1 Tax=Mixia osmundae (strain CBS 9802 / IAM 14324 / JCM 22182 / KY 12970) TaxID=764103 RepID=G7E7H1_MIXOS|nr:uncharacterized protein L969DRAFT_18398 [Mixia osmundae IAM 14324]KEI38384.1 hypothetical protein L969DRAFT_18398 [Mixia osmundae IAM 14324]GAA98781.1 hypothetical protein E5Q_05469 [Mixia osmundae IAM 14324]